MNKIYVVVEPNCTNYKCTCAFLTRDKAEEFINKMWEQEKENAKLLGVELNEERFKDTFIIEEIELMK